MVKKRKKRTVLSEELRELLLDELIAGKTSKILAHKFNISANTVRWYRRTFLETSLARKPVQGLLPMELPQYGEKK